MDPGIPTRAATARLRGVQRDVPLREDDAPAAADSRITSRKLMAAIASISPYRDTVIAVR